MAIDMDVKTEVAWQPIETLPKDACVVAFFHANEIPDCLPDEQYSIGYFDACSTPEICGDPGSFDWDDDMTPPTHWMPLPDSPKP